jgi:hypothetical protein
LLTFYLQGFRNQNPVKNVDSIWQKYAAAATAGFV